MTPRIRPLAVSAGALPAAGRAAPQSALDPQSSAAAEIADIAWLMFGGAAIIFAVVAIMALYTLVGSLAGRLDRERGATFDNTRLFWHYTVARGLLGLALIHLAPRLLG